MTMKTSLGRSRPLPSLEPSTPSRSLTAPKHELKTTPDLLDNPGVLRLDDPGFDQYSRRDDGYWA